MKRIALSLFAVAFLTAPALAGSAAVADKPMVLAQGVDVHVGGVEGDRDRDRDLHRHHRDVVVIKKHHEHDRDHHGEHHD
jgi:Ni/Co efflux regulator RcnB